MDPPMKRQRREPAALPPARLFNSDSPLTNPNADIQSFLSICIANWSSYTEDEKTAIVTKLPPAYSKFDYDTDGKLKCPVDAEFIANDSIIRDQVARFKRDIGDGFYLKTYQEKAQKAMEERANGKFDLYLAQHVDEKFPEGEAPGDDGDDELGGGTSDGDFGAGIGRQREKGRGHVEESRESTARASRREQHELQAAAGPSAPDHDAQPPL